MPADATPSDGPPRGAARPARIRPATVLDAEAVAAVELAAWRETYGDRVPDQIYAERARTGAQRWHDSLADPDGPMTWLAHRDGTPVGLARAEAPGAGHVRPLELALLHVLAVERRRGTGARLAELAIGDAPCFVWVAEADEESQAFYLELGFEPDGERRDTLPGGRLPEVRMVR